MVKAQRSRTVHIKPSDLPFACPPPNAPAWAMHPRVFLQISKKQPEADCPYCGTHFVLTDEDASSGDSNSSSNKPSTQNETAAETA